MADLKTRHCSVYIAPEETPMSQQEIQKTLESGKIDDKIRALKSLVIQIINDEQFQRMVMTVINTLVPIQDESHQLKKILLFYWEVIEKTHSNGVLKDEMILVCNSLRKDLLHPNEYIRGRTLKLLSRIQLRGILEPLQSAIAENVQHKHVYVRRNAVVCLYEIYLNFGDDLIQDLDELMEKFLISETDLSAKRNSFLLLYHASQDKALEYLGHSEDNTGFGDILQLSILELFRKVCKMDPTQKPKLLKVIYQFSKSKSPSVQYECANTLCAVSPSSNSLKIAVGIYMQLINTQTDNNIKLVVLDRLEQVKNSNPRVLEERTSDLTTLLSQQSIDIRRKVLHLLQKLVRNEGALILVLALQKELQKQQNNTEQYAIEFRQLILSTFSQLTAQFPNVHEAIAQVLIESVITNSKIEDQSITNSILITLVRYPNNTKIQQKLVTAFQNRFQDLHNIEIYKAALYILGNYSQDPIKSFNQIKQAIGSLPLDKPKQHTEEDTQTKTQVKTIILPDGTYGTVTVDKQQDQEHLSKLRELLMQHPFISSPLNRTLMTLLGQIEEQQFNKYASQALLIFCALLRYYQSNSNKVDQETVEKIYQSIRVLTGQNVKEGLLKYKVDEAVIIVQDNYTPALTILKQPDEQIVIRQLRGTTDLNEIDLADDEAVQNALTDTNSYVARLNHIVQLTGYSDPIYAEAYVIVHKYDIQFEVLFINRSPKMVQNVQIEFRTQGDSKILERAQGVTLQCNSSTRVRTSIKFSSSELGIIFGAIHYENNAGTEQPYIVTKEINIDLIDFIIPATIEIEVFRKSWAKYDWENRITINTTIKDPRQYVAYLAKLLKLKEIQDYDTPSNILCANLYAKTKLDDDFLINISAELIDDKLTGFVRIRSKVKGIVINLGDKIKMLQTKVE